MAAPYYFFEDSDYNGHSIQIGVEPNVSMETLPEGGTVALHAITGSIDGAVKVEVSNPKDAVPPLYPSLAERLALILTTLQGEIDMTDELDVLLTGLGYTGGSEPVADYVVTPGAGQFTHSWTDDPDIDIESIEQATLADYSDAYNIHSGPLTPPVVDTGFTTGDLRYFRIRGQRPGEDPGPWSYYSATAL